MRQIRHEKAARVWAGVFLILEFFAILACAYGLALKWLWPRAVGGNPRALAAYRILYPALRPMFYGFVAASAFLLLSSPFLMKTLRGAAVRAWLFGAAGFAIVFCLYFIRR